MTTNEQKETKRLYDIQYRKKNKEIIAEHKRNWFINNPEKIKESRIRNKNGKKISDKKYAQANKIKLNMKKKEWALANPEKNREAKTKYFLKKLSTDVLFKLKHTITTSIRGSFKKNGFTKRSRTHEILGCTFEEFRTYLESKFEPWMNWSNYGNATGISSETNITWDIDHIIPISSAITETDIIRLNHYTNLQPLCSYTNRWVKKDIMHDGFPQLV